MFDYRPSPRMDRAFDRTWGPRCVSRTRRALRAVCPCRSGRLIGVLTVGAALALGGCAGRVDPVPQPANLPEDFSAAGPEPLARQWWRHFDDPGLTHAVQRALSENFTLATAWDRLAQARAIARRQGALRRPAVDGDAAAGVDHRRVGGDTNTSDSLLLGLSAGYELDIWGRLENAYRATRFDVRASRHQLQAAAISLSASVARVWYQLAEQRQQAQLLTGQIETNRSLLRVITERFRQGQAPLADVLRQRQLIEQTEGQRTLARQEAAVLAHQLAVLLGAWPTADLSLREPRLVKLPALPETGVPAGLIRRRPDVRADFVAVKAADRRVASAVAEQYPRISLAADLQTTETDAQQLFSDWLGSLTANLAQPIFDAGQREAEVDRTQAVQREALHDYGQTILTALQQVEDALANETSQRRYLRSLRQQLATAESVVERTRTRYLNGQIEYLDVLSAIQSRQALQRQYLAARQQEIAFRIDLCRALAGPVSMPRSTPLTPADESAAFTAAAETVSNDEAPGAQAPADDAPAPWEAPAATQPAGE